MTKLRRLSIHCNLPSYISSSKCDDSCTRTLLCFCHDYYFTHEDWRWLTKSIELAHVLDSVSSPKIPFFRNLEALIHLRYVRVDFRGHSSNFGFAIGDVICNLWNLETLDLVCAYSLCYGHLRFSSRMWKPKRLRHIHTPISLVLSDFSRFEMKIMWNVQTLSYVALDETTTSLSQKGMFSHIRKLRLFIESINNKEWQQLWQGLQQLSSLHTLKLLLKLQPLANGVESIAFPAHITKLTLVYVGGLNMDIMTSLGNFTNLRILKLNGLYFGFTDSCDLKCYTGWFPQLQVFQMRRLNVQNWELANDAMPCLQRLVIKDCPDLHILPNELWSLTTLTQVQVLRAPEELAQMLQNLEMRDGVQLLIQ